MCVCVCEQPLNFQQACAKLLFAHFESMLRAVSVKEIKRCARRGKKKAKIFFLYIKLSKKQRMDGLSMVLQVTLLLCQGPHENLVTN